jgi:CubicO group peptidase (beta-lactamase class C family)
MARWVEFLLGEELPGVSKDCTGKVLEQMMTPWMYSGTSTHSEIGACHYGLGLSCERYRRLRVVTHGGSMPGWGALLSLLPDEGVGIVVLTNRDPTPVPNMLAFALFDDVCDLAPVDWYTRFADLRTKFLAKEAEERKASAAAPSREATRELVEYEGSYDEPAYGRLRVLLEGTRLVWSWRGLSGHLRARHNDQFVLEEVKPERHQEPLVATFLHDGSGGINRLFIALEPEVPEIVFRRAS